MVASSQTTLSGHAGSLYVKRWNNEAPRRTVILVHGYGEHIGRYEEVAAMLVGGGAVVWGLDHAGHGHSDGERGLIASLDAAVGDLKLLVDVAREANPELAVVLVAHSMGGAIGLRYAELHPDDLAGLVMSAPLIGSWAPAPILLALEDLPAIPIDPSVLSRDPAVCAAYSDDPLVYHGPFGRATLAAASTGLLEIALDADRVTIPILWQHGCDDVLVPLEGTRRGVDLLRNAEVQQRSYPGALHEIFFEINSAEVLADTMAFVAEVAPG